MSKTANQLEKFRLFSARAAQADYRASLKQVAKKEFTLEETDTTKKVERPEWAERANKSMPRTSNSEPVSGAVSDYEEEEEEA